MTDDQRAVVSFVLVAASVLPCVWLVDWLFCTCLKRWGKPDA